MSSISLLSQANLHEGSDGEKQTEKEWGQIEAPSATSANFFFAFVWGLTVCTSYLSRCLLHTSKAALDRIRKKAIINKELKINQLQSSFSLLLRDSQPCVHQKEQELYCSKTTLRLPHKQLLSAILFKLVVETTRKKNILISWWLKNLWQNNNYTRRLISISRTSLIRTLSTEQNCSHTCRVGAGGVRNGHPLLRTCHVSK